MFEDWIKELEGELESYLSTDNMYHIIFRKISTLKECQAKVEEKKKEFLADCFYYDEPFFKRIFGDVSQKNGKENNG